MKISTEESSFAHFWPKEVFQFTAYGMLGIGAIINSSTQSSMMT